MTDPNEILKKHFGYDSFRPGQRELVESILSGRDTLGVMPTGAGKSVCYQVPALMRGGTAIVISPLISLMQDQVSSLVQSGIRAAYINSSLTMNQLYTVLRNAQSGMYRLIYVAPERLDSEAFLSCAAKLDISMITVDEAHCISQWGQDFRPSYLNIPNFAAALPHRPVMTAFTATATERVREDIVRLLGLKDPYTLVTGFDRKNLYFEVRRPSDKTADLKRLVKKYSEEGRSGIIYCSTRKNVENVCERLCAEGISATRYHAGLSEEEKRANQEDFIYDRYRVMVATNAFGMGIDKSNVTYVIHYNMPKDIESYYQEAGRAGRDGSPSDCIILYSGQDVNTAKFLINKSFEESELDAAAAGEVRNRDLRRLRDMTIYCTCAQCLRSYILKYFGENAPAMCGNCSCCCSEEDAKDVTVEAQKIMSCIYRAGQRYGVRMISDILTGKENERISAAGLDKLSTYGIMKGSPDGLVRDITDKLIYLGYVEKTDGEYPVLKLTGSSLEVLRGEKTVTARLSRASAERRKKEPDPVYDSDPKLFEELKALRARLASVQGVPAYLIFTDSSLRDMCRLLPETNNDFLKVSGVGAAKLERYGDKFLEVIKAYRESSGIKPVTENTEIKKLRRNLMKTAADAAAAFDSIIEKSGNIIPDPSPVTVTALTDKLISGSETNIANAPLRKAITGWLTSQGLLVENESGRAAAEKAADKGIYNENVTSMTTGKQYIRIMYSPAAQKFITDSLEDIKSYAVRIIADS